MGAFGLYNYTLKNPSQNQNTNSNNYNTQTQGKIIFGITDAAASMSNISSVLITVDSAQIHSEQKGWIAVANEPKQYDLLALKQSGGIALIADTVVDMGTYNQVRLLVSKVVVVENGVQKGRPFRNYCPRFATDRRAEHGPCRHPRARRLRHQGPRIFINA